MDRLSNLRHAEGATKKNKRVGRGEGSGHGGTATRGMNGQMSRSGAKHRAWFEGGQMPLQRRVPKVGFTSPFKIVYQVINIAKLQALVDSGKLENNKITAVVLLKTGLLSSLKPYKILGDGNLTAKIEVEAYGFSTKAKEKIEAAGGTISQL
ncbi:MAG: 50S ribosomal protein L15 [Ignavibacteriales bacterium]|nr:50S ribosomal protein L15 [Ignavibacteriales bacterium]MBI5727396.1 50S ribosomal protein L15 [Ignavibacteriales bacterium]